MIMGPGTQRRGEALQYMHVRIVGGGLYTESSREFHLC